jgi:hypothetical protein
LAWLKSGRKLPVFPEDSTAAAYAKELIVWLPEATELRLVARHEGRDATSVSAFVDAARGLAKTLTFVETENGVSICGGYLDVAWVDGDYAKDPGGRSFIFTLKNHLGVPATKFAQRGDERAAYMGRKNFYFGYGEGFMVWQGDSCLSSGQAYVAPGGGVALFHGDGGGLFRAARWELWQVR